MRMVNSTEFRARLREYLDIAMREPLLITRSGGQVFVLRAVADEDVAATDESRGLWRGVESPRSGKVCQRRVGESIEGFVRRLRRDSREE